MWRARSMAICCLFVLLGRLASAEEKPKKLTGDLEKLQGTWTVLSKQVEGEKEESPKDVVLVIKDNDSIVIVKGKKEDSAELVIDDTKSPKEIDIKASNTEVMKGIYHLEGDLLKICFCKDAKGARPKKFESAKGQILLKFERTKS
jgi:uncharacterized protein (TIGR03067 family)